MYKLQAADDKDEASDDEESDDEEEITRLRQQIATLEKQLAEKSALANNQENLIVSMQRKLAGARTVTDHEPRYALEQALKENASLRERLGQPPSQVPEAELRQALSVLTGTSAGRTC